MQQERMKEYDRAFPNEKQEETMTGVQAGRSEAKQSGLHECKEAGKFPRFASGGNFRTLSLPEPS